MCGIVAVVGSAGSGPAVPVLLQGLQRLEYRGYDSAGIALARNGELLVTKVDGRVGELRVVADERDTATTGIAHTRWATHGKPSRRNAHPHLDGAGRIAVVHNGIIENADELRAKLVADGTTIVSDTDTEVLAHLIAAALGSRAADPAAGALEHAVRSTLDRVAGTYGLVVLDRDRPDELVVARNGSPVVLGLTDDATYVASDVAAFVVRIEQLVHLQDGDIVTITSSGYSAMSAPEPAGDSTGADAGPSAYELGEHADFMIKEIHDQPRVLAQALRGRLDDRFGSARLGGMNLDARDLRGFKRVKILGCGSAYYAGQLGATAIEELARIPADAEPAAEFRYRNPIVEHDTLYVAVSQSGETVDTLMAVQELRRKGAFVIGVVNVVGSAIARETGRGVFIHAGPELSVASTKAVTNMSACFVLLGLLLGRVRDLSPASGARLLRGLNTMPAAIDEVLHDSSIAGLAEKYARAKHMYFIGRYRGFPVAREGAQKLKEISYIHAEAYQASELKHGPLALIDDTMPSIVIVPDDELVSKNIATIEQIRSRNGQVLAIAGVLMPDGVANDVIRIPPIDAELAPILLTIPLQLLSYHIAHLLGRDVDKPRNLAKSVTVE